MSVPSEMLQKELFMLLLLLWISSVAHISLLYKMYLTLEEKKILTRVLTEVWFGYNKNSSKT